MTTRSARFGASLLAALASFTSFLPAAEPALDRLVPGDAAFALSIDDLPGLRQRFAATPFGRVWADPAMQRFVEPFLSNPDFKQALQSVKDETGHSFEELLDFATGDLLLTVPVSSLSFGKKEAPGAGVLIAIEIGENEGKIREIVAQQQAKRSGPRNDSVEDYNGVQLHTQPPPEGAPAHRAPLVWALHQGRWFIGNDRALVTGALDALAAGGLSESLSASPSYRAVLDRSGGRSDYALLIDIAAIYPALVASIDATRPAKTQSNPFGLEPAMVFKALGFDALGQLSASGTVAADGSSSSDLVFTFSEVRGISALLAYLDGPVVRPDWVPASWINVSSQNFSLPEVYAEFERILMRMNPMLSSMAMGQLKALERQVNVDFKRDLLGNLGTRVLSGVSQPVSGGSGGRATPYDELEQFFAVSLEDAAAFERVVESLKSRFVPPGIVEKRDYLGRAVYVVDPKNVGKPDSKPFAYAITDGWLMFSVGSTQPLELALQGMNKAEPGASFWARPDVRRALEDAPSSAFSVQVADLAPMFASLCSFAVKVQENRDDEGASFVDPEALPPMEVFEKYRSQVVTLGERKTGEIRFRTVTTAPAP